MDCKYVVIETYKDGGTWKHFYQTLHSALWNKQEMEEAHRGRSYELVVASD